MSLSKPQKTTPNPSLPPAPPAEISRLLYCWPHCRVYPSQPQGKLQSTFAGGGAGEPPLPDPSRTELLQADSQHTHARGFTHMYTWIQIPAQESKEGTGPRQGARGSSSLKPRAIPPGSLHGPMADHSGSQQGLQWAVSLQCSKKDVHRGHFWSQGCQGEAGQTVSTEPLRAPVADLGSLAQ